MILFFFQAEDGIRDIGVTGVQTCALPIYLGDPVDLHDLAAELAADDKEGAVSREVQVVDARAGDRQARDGLPGRRVVEVQAVDRESGVEGKRVDLGGRRNIKKKNKQHL